MITKETTSKYNHAEAFCLMLYTCETCGFMEVLWNSRDGVTPFIIGCRYCRGEALHKEMNLDRCIPEYNPFRGQRIFVDITKEKAEEIADKRIKNVRGEPHPAMPPMTKERYESIVDSIYNNGEAPVIKVV